MKNSLVKGAALLAASVLGFAGLSLTPANAATKTSVTVYESSALSSLNPSTPATNLVTNTDVVYPTGMGFAYYDNGGNLVRNTKFGTYKITKNVTGDFEVTYTIKKGLKWSDGTLITGQDLLLSHILASSDYSLKAGLGDTNVAPKFDSGSYGGPYDSHTTATSVDLSDDNYSVTVKYDSFQPDWAILGPGPSPVHALVALAKGKKALQTVRTNASYKNVFEDAFYAAIDDCGTGADLDQDCQDAKDAAQALLKKIGTKWSTAFNITTVNSSTNPLLLISNGGYKISNCVDNVSCTLTRNALYNDGPAITGNVDTIVYKYGFSEAAAATALNNGEVDVYDGQPTSAIYAQLKGYSGVTTVTTTTMTYEHLDLRVGTSNTWPDQYTNSCPSTYTGPFAGNSQRAKDLRTAFLLTVPRQAIANLEIAQLFDPSSTAQSAVLNSSFLLPANKAYAGLVKSSGISNFIDTTDAQRTANTAKALALVKKYYPSAAAGSNSVDVTMLFRNNARRIGENALIATEAAKAGFNVSRTGNAAWSTQLNCNNYDAHVFAWAPSSVSQTGTNANFQSDGSNNHYGWNDATVDAATHALEGSLTAAQLSATYLAAEKAIYANAWSVPLYQWAGVAAYNSDLKNVKPSPLVPNIVWNYWQWSY